MSIMYCDFCDLYIDTDFNLEHFNEDGECENEKEQEIKFKSFKKLIKYL